MDGEMAVNSSVGRDLRTELVDTGQVRTIANDHFCKPQVVGSNPTGGSTQLSTGPGVVTGPGFPTWYGCVMEAKMEAAGRPRARTRTDTGGRSAPRQFSGTSYVGSSMLSAFAGNDLRPTGAPEPMWTPYRGRPSSASGDSPARVRWRPQDVSRANGVPCPQKPWRVGLRVSQEVRGQFSHFA